MAKYITAILILFLLMGMADPKDDLVFWAFQNRQQLHQRHPRTEDRVQIIYEVYNNKVAIDPPLQNNFAGPYQWRKASPGGSLVLADGKGLHNPEIRRGYQTAHGLLEDVPFDEPFGLVPVVFYNPEYPSKSLRRVYINPHARSADIVYADAIRMFLDTPPGEPPFFSQIKIFGGQELHERVDSIVMYGGDLEGERLLALVSRFKIFYARNRQHLMTEVPAGTSKILPGISWAPESSGTSWGGSFGRNFAEAIVEVIDAKRSTKTPHSQEDIWFHDLVGFRREVNKHLNNKITAPNCSDYRIPINLH